MTLDIMAKLKASPNMFPDTIQVRTPASAPDGFGEVATYTTRNLRCRVVGQHTNVEDPAQTKKSNVYAIFDGSYGLTKDDEYTLPVRFSPRVVKALDVTHESDETGELYDKVVF